MTPTPLRTAFLSRIAGLSSREAALATGIAFSTIARLRRGEGEYVSSRVVKAMRCYVDGVPFTPEDSTFVARLKALETRIDRLEYLIGDFVR